MKMSLTSNRPFYSTSFLFQVQLFIFMVKKLILFFQALREMEVMPSRDIIEKWTKLNESTMLWLSDRQTIISLLSELKEKSESFEDQLNCIQKDLSELKQKNIGNPIKENHLLANRSLEFEKNVKRLIRKDKVDVSESKGKQESKANSSKKKQKSFKSQEKRQVPIKILQQISETSPSQASTSTSSLDDIASIRKSNLEKTVLLTQQQKEALSAQFKARQLPDICSATLLYKFTENKLANVHKLIDYRKNILLVAKLTSGKVVGGFTEICINKRYIPEENQKAFIVDFSNNEYYKPKNPCKTICYDEKYLLFGNSEIRIKMKESKMYSNLGISQGFFDSEGATFREFFGNESEKREIELQDYQVYALD